MESTQAMFAERGARRLRLGWLPRQGLGFNRRLGMGSTQPARVVLAQREWIDKEPAAQAELLGRRGIGRQMLGAPLDRDLALLCVEP